MRYERAEQYLADDIGRQCLDIGIGRGAADEG